MNNFSRNDIINMALRLPAGGLFIHIRTGHMYQFVCFARNTENTNEYAVYHGVNKKDTWVRPIEEFTTDRFENLNKVAEPLDPTDLNILDASELR
jgi:hypothetical protein